MLFDMEEDYGSRVVLYVVPDSGGTTPSVRVRGHGTDLLTLSANHTLPHLIEAGRHSTGLVGFVIDDTMVPGLAGFDDLEIIEVASNIIVYRRQSRLALEHSVFRLETHLLPLWRLDEALKDRFQYWYCGVDRFGRETSTQVFCLEAASRYISGRLLYRNFEVYLAQGVKCVGMFRDPFHEFAERLVLLKNIGSRGEEILGSRDVMTFGPVIAALQEVDLDDEADCKRFFKRVPHEVMATLSNPMVRQLSGTTPDDMPSKSALALTLDALASFELIGIRSEAEAFTSSLAELIGVDAAAIPQVGEYPRIAALGERLRAIHAIEEFLEKDLEVFHLITHAFRSAEAHP